MKITDPRARSLLAAEYVTGAMHGAARRRFELWLRSDPGLRREVQQWTERLMPLDEQAAEVEPSAAVWNAISARIDPARARVGATAQAQAAAAEPWWQKLAFWRWTSGLSTAAMALLVGWIVIAPRPDTPAMPMADARVVVLNDNEANPRMTVAWMPKPGSDKVRLRVRVIRHDTMEKGTAWELWCLPKGSEKPQSLGLMNTDETQEIEVPASLIPMIEQAVGMAMSVEPEGGSPTGLPTGPIPYKGAKVRL